MRERRAQDLVPLEDTPERLPDGGLGRGTEIGATVQRKPRAARIPAPQLLLLR
jgi:hypothetical protein